MDPIRKGNLFVILTIAIIAFGVSTVASSFTGADEVLNMLNITNDNKTTELLIVSDGNFVPKVANQVSIEIANNTTNITNNTDTNVTNNGDRNISKIRNVTNKSNTDYRN